MVTLRSLDAHAPQSEKIPPYALSFEPVAFV